MKNIYLTTIVVEVLIIIVLFLRIFILKRKNKIIINNLYEYENIIDEQGQKNHEYNNQLLILNGYIDDKEKLKEYLDTIIEDHRTGQNYEIRQLSNLPNNGLKSLLYYKIAKMKKNNIKYYIYIASNLKETFDSIDTLLFKDITKVFGVIIDNAIDGSLRSEKKEIDLDFSKDGKYIIIKVINTYDEDSISNIWKKGFTTKGIGHGFGLSIIKSIVKKNDRIEVVTDFDDYQFNQTILIDTK